MIKINSELRVKLSFNFPKNKFGEMKDNEVQADVSELAEKIKDILLEEYAVSEYGSVDVEMVSATVER